MGRLIWKTAEALETVARKMKDFSWWLATRKLGAEFHGR